MCFRAVLCWFGLLITLAGVRICQGLRRFDINYLGDTIYMRERSLVDDRFELVDGDGRVVDVVDSYDEALRLQVESYLLKAGSTNRYGLKSTVASKVRRPISARAY